MSQPQTARAVIRNAKGELLLIERHNHGKHYFVLPGGHVDSGETPQQAVVREVLEETGLAVTVKKHIRSEIDSLGNLQHIYACVYTGGQPALQPHSVEARFTQPGKQTWHPKWYALDDLQDKVLYPRWLLDVLQMHA